MILSLRYRDLTSAANAADALAGRLEAYSSSLNTRVRNRIQSTQGGVNGNLTQADIFAHNKIKQLDTRSRNARTLANRINHLQTTAQSIDGRVYNLFGGVPGRLQRAWQWIRDNGAQIVMWIVAIVVVVLVLIVIGKFLAALLPLLKLFSMIKAFGLKAGLKFAMQTIGKAIAKASKSWALKALSRGNMLLLAGNLAGITNKTKLSDFVRATNAPGANIIAGIVDGVYLVGSLGAVSNGIKDLERLSFLRSNLTRFAPPLFTPTNIYTVYNLADWGRKSWNFTVGQFNANLNIPSINDAISNGFNR